MDPEASKDASRKTFQPPPLRRNKAPRTTGGRREINLFALVLLAFQVLVFGSWHMGLEVESTPEQDPLKDCMGLGRNSKPSLMDMSSTVPHSVTLWDFPLPRITKQSLVIVVLSRRDAFSTRKVIRNTWGKQHDNVYFVVGQACPVHPSWRAHDEGGNKICQVAPRVLDQQYFNLTMEHAQHEQTINQQLLQEQKKYGDILMTHEADVYRNLPIKLKAAYTFVDNYLPQSVQWVLKVDDDFFVQVEEFSSYLDELMETKRKSWATKNATIPEPWESRAVLISGEIRWKRKARDGGKWKEVPQWPKGAEYPTFPMGSAGHVVNRPIFHYISEYQSALFDYQGEDVSIGIWLDQEHAPKVEFTHANVMKRSGACEDDKILVVGHKIDAERMQSCYLQRSKGAQ